MDGLSPVEVAALSRVVTSAQAAASRDELTPGTHLVDLVVRVQGALQVAPDTERTPTASIPVKEVLALFVARSGATRERTLTLLRECLTEALSKGPRGQAAIDAAADIEAVFHEAVAELLADLPPTPVRGRVQAALAVERVTVVRGA